MRVNATEVSSPPEPSNRLLARLPEADYQRVARYLEPVRLPSGQVLLTPEAPPPRILFPGGGVCAVTCVMADGEMVDVALVGNEGLVGLSAVFKSDIEVHEVRVRIPNNAQAMSVTAFRSEMERGGSFCDVMTHYAHAFVANLMQSVACNALHPIEKRCARWLLDIQDRLGRAEFPLTQELLATMLGVRRASVTVCAGDLHHGGLIDYARRRLVIRDRAGLEAVSCECYATVKGNFSRLLGE